MKRLLIVVGALVLVGALGMDLLGIGRPGIGPKQVALALLGAALLFGGLAPKSFPWCKLMYATLLGLGLMAAGMFGFEAYLEATSSKVNSNLVPPHYRSIQLREWPPSRTFLVEPMGMERYDNLEQKVYKMETDRDGFIMPSRVHEEPDLEIVFLGGSTTECMFVDEEKRFVSLAGRLLRKAYGRVNTYNGGKAGNNTLHSVNNLMNKVIPMEPDAVVMMHNVNDLSPLMFGETNWTKEVSGRSTITDHSTRVTWKQVVATLFPNIWVYGVTPGDEWTRLKIGEKRELDHEFMLHEFRKNVLTFVNLCEARELRPILMTQASRLSEVPDERMKKVAERIQIDFIIDYAGYRDLHESFNQVIRDVGREKGVYVIDLANKVPKEDTYLCDAFHFNGTGSELVAQIIADELATLNLGQ